MRGCDRLFGGGTASAERFRRDDKGVRSLEGFDLFGEFGHAGTRFGAWLGVVPDKQALS